MARRMTLNVALNPCMTQWVGMRVWLIGASSGIGRATAAALHAQGAKVIVSARQAQALRDFVLEHPGSQALPLDVTDRERVQTAVATLMRGGCMDCVVYCAGHYVEQHADALDLPELLRHLEVNYLGALYLLDALVPHLLAQPPTRRGHISLVGSIAGYRGLPKSLAYGPTKAALINLTETLYIDLHPHGIGVSLINPGFVDTPLTANNRFKMPALITPEVAAEEILRGWARGAFEIHFPRRLTLGVKLLELLPYPAFFAAMRRLRRR